MAMPHSIQLQSFDMISSIVRYIASTASSSSVNVPIWKPN